MNNDRIIILDTETTGLDYLIKDRIIEIGAVELIDKDKIGKTFHYYINPGININPESTKIHGITDEMVKDKPTFKEIAPEFLNFISDSLIVAHNSEFDRNFLNLELFLHKMEVIPKSRFIDTLLLAKKLYRGDKNSLDDLCNRFNIDNSARQNFHGALIDAKILAKVYIQLNNILNSELVYKNGENKNFDKLGKYSVKFPYRFFKLNEEELREHHKFLKLIKNPMWN